MSTAADLLQGFILLTGIGGQLFVARRRWHGFLLWIACNAAMIHSSLPARQYGMVALYSFYTLTCLYSIWHWRRLDRVAPRQTPGHHHRDTPQ